MKKLIVMLFIPVILFGITPDSHATLEVWTDGTENVVYDDVTGQLWIWDLQKFLNQTYNAQQFAIGQLNVELGYYGTTGWHMANIDEMTALWNYTAQELAAAFAPTWFNNDGEPVLWEGRYGEAHDGYSHYYAYVWY